jgi:putative flippase GtrA
MVEGTLNIMKQDAGQGPFPIEVKRSLKFLMVVVGAYNVSALMYWARLLVGRLRYTRYLAVSAMSLGVDLANFLLMVHMDVPAVQASMLGYMSGLVAHWLLSSRLVFADKIQPTLAARARQQLLFVVSALVGLAITAAMIKGGLRLGINPGLSKLAAIAVSFNVTYMLRRNFIFH